MVDAPANFRERLQALGPVAVLAGGDSAEREISLKSGAAVLQGLLAAGANATLVDPSVADMATLKNFNACFVALHGRGGEDGVIQGVLEYLHIPYTGSGVMASSIGMDKMASKLIWRALDLATPDFFMADADTDNCELPFPVMVKPAREGSSIGMYKVDNAQQFSLALSSARQYDANVMVESWVQGGEYTVAILNGEALPPIKLETPNRFYDYEAKYSADSTRYLCPCGLDEKQERELQALALKAFGALGCQGWGRVDVMQDSNGTFLLLEVNTVPGMTDHSLVPMAASAAGVTFDQLVSRILLSSGETR